MQSVQCLFACVLFIGGFFLPGDQAHAEAAPYKPLAAIKFHPERSAPATAISLNDAVISAELTAVVKQVKARVSEFVEQGDLLVELDCTDYTLTRDRASALLDSANASAALARSQLNRAKELLGKELTSQQQYDIREAELLGAVANVKQQQVQLRQAEVGVGRCLVRAPFSGIVTERFVAKGQLASAGMPLVSLTDTEQLELSARISANDYQHFGDAREFTFDFGRQISATLYNSGGVIDPQTRNVEARFQFPDDKPMPGTAGKLHWQDSRPFIHARYVVKRNNYLGVFVYDESNGSVAFKAIPNAVTGRPVPVNLPLSTLIMTEKLDVLNDGDTLK